MSRMAGFARRRDGEAIMKRLPAGLGLLPWGGSVTQIGPRKNTFSQKALVLIPFSHRLIFVRHGETPYNAENRLQGQRDVPLGARGRDQARAVGRTLRARIGAEIDRLEAADAFVASPLLRTRETMELVRGAMGLASDRYRLDPALKELTFGDWEGLTWPEVTARDPKGLAARRADKWNFVPPKGESYAMLAARLQPWLHTVTADAFVV